MDHSSDFDPISFLKFMELEHSGRAYRKQATELVSLCRVFVRLGEDSVRQDADLRNVLEVADDALTSASYTMKVTSNGTDEKFEKAVDVLSTYAQKYHPGQRHIAERMRLAKEKDISSLRALNRLKRSFKAKPMKVARFLILRSPLDESPTVVEQVLGEETSVEEVFWNFSRLEGNQRITLQQNPYFYNGLPRSARAYSHDFTAEPIENFRDETEILVLIDKQSRLFLEAGEIKRVFGNFWVPDEAIIFKDVHGRLQGERVVAADIKSPPHLWIRTEPSVTPGESSPGNPLNNRMFQDWRQLVRESLGSPNVSICISTRDAPPEGLQGAWLPAQPSTRELARASVSPHQPLAPRVSKPFPTRPQPLVPRVSRSSSVRPQPPASPVFHRSHISSSLAPPQWEPAEPPDFELSHSISSSPPVFELSHSISSSPPVFNLSHTSSSPPPAVFQQSHSSETRENTTPSIIAPATHTIPPPTTRPIHHVPTRDSNRGGRRRRYRDNTDPDQ